MVRFDTYHAARFQNARLARKPNGVLEVRFHSRDGKLIFNGHTHEQFVDLFHVIGEDRENRVVILTRLTGDAFMDSEWTLWVSTFYPRRATTDSARGPQGSLEHSRY